MLTFCNSGSINLTVTKSPTLTAAAFLPTSRAKISRPVIPSPTAALERSMTAGITVSRPVKYILTEAALIPPSTLSKLTNCSEEILKETSNAFGSINSPKRSFGLTRPPSTPVTFASTPSKPALTAKSFNFL